MTTVTEGAPRNLAAALAAFQAAMPIVAKTKTAKTEKFSYTYAGLAEVMRSAAPLLSAHGLSFTCMPAIDEHGHITLDGLLLHSSGEQLVGSLPIAGGTPQQIGSALTYARRYLLGCMTGIVTDDDDDGQLASSKARKPAAAPAGPPSTVRRKPAREVAGQPVTDVPLPDTAPIPPGVSEPAGVLPHAVPQQAPQAATAPDSEAVAPVITDSLRRSLMSATSRVGIDPDDRAQRLALWSALLAHPITSTHALSRSEALTLLRRLNDCETGAVEWAYSVETGAVSLTHVERPHT